MQQPLRLLSKNGGALGSIFIATRGIHTSSIAPVALPSLCSNSISGSKAEEVTLSSDIANSSRTISNASFTNPRISRNQIRVPTLTPRAKANFNTSIARKDLGFLPFESSVIFPMMDFTRGSELPEVRVPYLPDNLNPDRPPEPEYKVTRPIIQTVSDASTHIVAPVAIMEGFRVDFSFLKEESQAEKDEKDEDDAMMRAFRGA